MFPWLDGLLTVVVDRSPEELLGAIILALVLSAGLAPIAVRIGRSKRDQVARMTGLMLVLAVVMMMISGTFVQAQIDSEPFANSFDEHQYPPIVPPPDSFWLIAVLDENADGRVDPRELRQAAEKLGTENRLKYHVPHSGFGRRQSDESRDNDRSDREPRRDDSSPRPESPRPDPKLPTFSARNLQ